MPNPDDPNAPAPPKPPAAAGGRGAPKPADEATDAGSPSDKPAAGAPTAANPGSTTMVPPAPSAVKPVVAAKPSAPAVAKPATPAGARAAAAARPAAPAAPKEHDPNQLRRRLTWTAIVAFLVANLLMFLRFFFPRVLFEPSTVCNLGYPSDYVLGVSDRFKQQCRIYVVREPTQIFAIFAKCTHLGCTPDWKPGENKFKCPCHGSGYTPEGINFEGPAPRPMDRAHVELDAQGHIIADTSRLFTWDRSKGGRDEFNDEGAFVSV